MRRSLLSRLLAVSVLVAMCSIAATAWLAAVTTSGTIEQEQGQALADDGKIYQGLLSYAATHPDWRDVGPLLRDYARTTGRRVALTSPDHTPIADSAAQPAPLPERASVTVDPLSVETGLGASATADRISDQATGPFTLPEAERTRLFRLATRVLTCVRGRGPGAIKTSPSGRPEFVSSEPALVRACGGDQLSRPTPTELAALTELTKLTNDCLARQGISGVPRIQLGFTWRPEPRASGAGSAIRGCIAQGRHEQLRSFVAPAALLYITSPGGENPGVFDLSAGNIWRVAGVASGILMLTIAVTVLAGTRLIRPLRALTVAAQRMEAGQDGATVAVKGQDEIARLATAFNDMSASREHLERMRKTMVSDTAHELRTPLSNIRGWLEAGQDGVTRLDDELVASLLEEALHLEHIVDDLQDLAMADAGMLRLHPEPVDANHLLSQVTAAHTPHTAAEGVALSVRPLEQPDVFADPVRLRQALDNLVSNAIRHTPRGGSVIVRGHRDGGDVVFEVADSGTGIAEEDLAHVFDRFWRADKSRNRRSGGSGLGLAIVRKLAEAHGGSVTAASVPDQGSTFALRLPVTGPEPAPAEAP